MKKALGFDPARHDYGPATPAVRRLLASWQEVDWFAPPTHPGARDRARRLFEKHHRFVRLHRPDLVPEAISLSVERGGFAEFTALGARVRGSGWDWKYSVLKRLSFEHSKAHGWSLPLHARTVAPAGGVGSPGDLFARLDDEHVFWQSPGPSLDFRSWLDATTAEAASWYLGYACMDLLECLEWQLAEGRAEFATNPFVPLVAVYSVGLYPVSVSATEVLLFEFTDSRASGGR